MAEVSTVRQAPAEFIEAAGKTYLDDLTSAVGGIKGLDVSKLYGQQFVAGPGALQTQAETLASGLGGYQPYLQAAGQYFGGAGQAQQTAAGMVGPQAYQAYMSPYQQDVIDTSLREYDIQAQKGLPQLAAQAISAGAFGGGREGVQRAEYQSASDRNRAALQAQLLQQGYGQAQQAAAQAFGQQQQLSAGQLGLGQAQMGLASAYPSLLGQQIATYSTLGAQQQAQEQARLQAQQNLAYQQAYQPLQAAQTFGQGVTGLIAGYPGQTRTQIDPSPSALQTGLSAASTLAGIYRAYNPPAQQPIPFYQTRPPG
jgi:hypothetical protein